MLALSENFITADDDLETTLARVTNAAVDLIDGIGYADLMLVQDGELLSVAPADPFVADLDALQMQLEKGRAAAAVDDAIVWCNDLQQDERWPAFSGPALAGGVRGVLSYQLSTNRGGSGALNLFSTEPYAVDADGEVIGAMLATHAAGVMMAVNRRQEFESALASRDFIGQAKASS